MEQKKQNNGDFVPYEEILFDLVKNALLASNRQQQPGRYYILRFDKKEASIDEIVNGRSVRRGYRKFTNGCP